MILDELYRKFDVKGEEEKWSMIQIIHSLVCHELESRVTKFSEVELISKILGLLGLGRTIELNRARERFVEVLEHDIAGYFWDDFEDEEEDEDEDEDEED